MKLARGRKPLILENEIREDFCEAWFGREDRTSWPLWIDDVVSGVARLDWYGDRDEQIPLSTLNIIKCFTTLDTITTESVRELLCIGKRQAERYASACRLCYPFFERSLENPSILTMRYPRKSIVTTEHGEKLHYDSKWTEAELTSHNIYKDVDS
jgi:hypothetical protein